MATSGVRRHTSGHQRNPLPDFPLTGHVLLTFPLSQLLSLGSTLDSLWQDRQFPSMNAGLCIFTLHSWRVWREIVIFYPTERARIEQSWFINLKILATTSLLNFSKRGPHSFISSKDSQQLPSIPVWRECDGALLACVGLQTIECVQTPTAFRRKHLTTLLFRTLFKDSQ